MKIKITMKDPDGVSEAIRTAVEEEVSRLQLPDDEAESITELRTEKVKAALKKWFEYEEYLTVELDTEDGTCTVQERS